MKDLIQTINYHSKNPKLHYSKKKLISYLMSFLLPAVRTGLEPATPCVTGMYSNQTELPDPLANKQMLKFADAKV